LGEPLNCNPKRLEKLQRATQNQSHQHIALTRFVNYLALAQNTAGAQRFQQGQLPIVELGKSDAPGVLVEFSSSSRP
jgi:hypothetical protein